MVKTTVTETEQPKAGWRFRLGLTILIVGWLSPVLIPVITRTSLSTEWKTIISGLLAVGIPEVFTVAAPLWASRVTTISKSVFLAF